MPPITWTEDFVLGVEQFDTHHQHLISLINETSLCLERGAPQNEVSTILTDLIDYALYHFNAEENWMKEHKYPQFEDHCAIHKEFSKNIKELQTQLASGNASIAEELSTYLNFWLIDHIVICDSRYATFTGTRKEPVVMT
jgi:hemerythrin-like metal-binding protein